MGFDSSARPQNTKPKTQNTKTMALKTLTFDLYSEAFVGFTRRTYDQPYTTIPKTAYSEDVGTIMEAFAKAIGADPESQPLTVVAREGYAQRLASPRIYKNEDSLVLRYDRENLPLTRVDNDGEISYTIGSAKAAITISEDRPTLMVQLPKGLKVLVPFHTVYSEEKIPALKLLETIDDGDYSQVSSLPGSGGTLNFSALKYLPIGRYPVVSTELKTDGKFGPKIKMTLANKVAQTIACTVSTDGVWSLDPTCEVEAGSKLVVDANTALARQLQGLVIKESDNVVLDIVSKRNDEEDPSKIYVTANLDFSASETYGFKEW
jgi:hypothetical protein